jgi:hypothetical protein
LSKTASQIGHFSVICVQFFLFIFPSKRHATQQQHQNGAANHQKGASK